MPLQTGMPFLTLKNLHMLSKAIQLYAGPGIENVRSRITLSTGTEPAPDHYRKDGRLPKLPWRPPTDEEYELLAHQSYETVPTDYTETVGLVKIPQNLIEVFEQLNLRQASTNQELGELILQKKEEMGQFDQELNTFLSEFYTETPRRRFLGAFALPPNLTSVATDKNTSAPLGLHFDNSIGFPVEQFEGKPNRISLNVGKQSRHLYFMNQGLEEVYQDMHGKAPFVDEVELAYQFLKHYPEKPVVRLTVEPYEAYIAPTDHVIHDGSTLGTTEPDITLVIMGYFGPHQSVLTQESVHG